MSVTLYYRENVTPLLAALLASIDGPSPYDRGRRIGVLLVATALGIPLQQLVREERAFSPDVLAEIEEIVRRGFEK